VASLPNVKNDCDFLSITVTVQLISMGCMYVFSCDVGVGLL